METLKEKIEAKKSIILPKLLNWFRTWEFDEMETSNAEFDELMELYERFDTGECTDADYIDIEYHIEQINHDKEIIIL